MWAPSIYGSKLCRGGREGGVGEGRGGAAGSCCVLKHRGAPLYEWNQVRHRSLLLVQLSRGPGADGGPV